MSRLAITILEQAMDGYRTLFDLAYDPDNKESMRTSAMDYVLKVSDAKRITNEHAAWWIVKIRSWGN